MEGAMFFCRYCDKSLDKDRKFCNFTCKNNFHKLKKRNLNKLNHLENKNICSYCCEEFIVRRRKDEKYCSDKCKIEYHKKQARDVSSERRKNTYKICKLCETKFSPKKTTKEQYCSKKCRELIPKKIYAALRRCCIATGEKKLQKTNIILGYTPQQLQDHVKNHPNWKYVKNNEWHLDHIFPIIAFLDYGIVDFSVICCLDNLQPITGKENCRKNGKYSKKEFECWIDQKESLLNDYVWKIS